MDTEYLRKQVGGCLVNCLAEVVQKRPFDPIEYIAQYLYKYLENEENAKKVNTIVDSKTHFMTIKIM